MPNSSNSSVGESRSLLTSALRQLSTNLTRAVEEATETPSEWIEKFFYVYDPRDPETGIQLSPGPIRLSTHQKRIINEALSKDENGNLKYATVVYSAPKKSGKSAIASAVAFYMGMHNDNSYVACLANDEKQAGSRLYEPIYKCLRMHTTLGGPLAGINANLGNVTLPNFTRIEAVPCDAAGEAGSQPVGVFISEAWGYETEKKRRVFTEFTIPPTLYGRAIRWIETYAGYTGKSLLLEQIYNSGFVKGSPHPDFLDLQGKNGPVVRVNDSAKMFVYWDTEPRMLWQTSDYYQQEAAILVSSEFKRIHGNEWSSPLESFVEEMWWRKCQNAELPTLTDKSVPVVVGIDMAVSRDCAALVAVTRDPFDPETKIAVRAVKIFSPKDLGGVIDQEKMVRPVIEDWAERWNVVCWAYDPKEMAKLAQDLVRAGVGWFKPFGQTSPRAISDKQLHDMILAQQISWNPNTTEGDVGYYGEDSDQQTLYKHVIRAGANVTADAYRIQKLSDSAKVDAAVALSQAAFVALKLSISNKELNPKNILELLRTNKITTEEFSKLVQKANPKLVERMLNDNR